MFFVWVLDVSLVTGLTRYVITFQSPRQEDTGVGPWGGGRRSAPLALGCICSGCSCVVTAVGPAPLPGAPSLGQTASVEPRPDPSLPGSPPALHRRPSVSSTQS